MIRTAKTRKGRTVALHQTVRVDGGWQSYVLNRRGFAVLVFTPED